MPDGIAEREFSDILYGRNTPYGWRIEYADVDNIQRQDLMNFYHRYYFPANIMLAIYGDFSAADMKSQTGTAVRRLEIHAAPRAGVSQGAARSAAPGIIPGRQRRTSRRLSSTSDIWAANCATRIIRRWKWPRKFWAADFPAGCSAMFAPQHGWAYNIGAAWARSYDHPGTFRISGSTQSAHTVDTLKAIREELEKIRTSEVTDPGTANRQGHRAERLRVPLRPAQQDAESPDAV